MCPTDFKALTNYSSTDSVKLACDECPIVTAKEKDVKIRELQGEERKMREDVNELSVMLNEYKEEIDAKLKIIEKEKMNAQTQQKNEVNQTISELQGTIAILRNELDATREVTISLKEELFSHTKRMEMDFMARINDITKKVPSDTSSRSTTRHRDWSPKRILAP